ncbi:MAG: hypothetical protein HC844_00260 [Tabrizicola sp.]|nr:hypothetical protein [Tabrizicola sp.]
MFTPEEIARRRLSADKHLHRLRPRPGYIRATHALKVVQIDHMPADIQFIEVIDDDGVFVGRSRHYKNSVSGARGFDPNPTTVRIQIARAIVVDRSNRGAM